VVSTTSRIALLVLPLILSPGCHTGVPAAGTAPSAADAITEESFARWIDGHVARIRPLERAQALSYWTASGSGKSEDYEASAAAELALKRVYADRDHFEYLKSVRASGRIHDPKLARQLELLYLGHLGNQFDPALMERIVTLSSSIEEKFNTYRAEVDGRKLSDNEVQEVLSRSADSEARRKVWEASKRIGDVVSTDLITLVKLRNEAARQLGYENFYKLSLALDEQDETELFTLLDEMARLTDGPFREIKSYLDGELSKRYGVASSALRPWHMEDRFFQETPSVGSVDLDPYYKGRDPNELAAQFYDSLGLPARQVIARSDLKGRDGKYQHAYCIDMDREGDVRVMASVLDNLYWMDTQLHELGHAVYSVGHDANPDLPFLLRDSAHTLTTEGVANLMGRLASNPHWMKRFLALTDAQVAELEPKLLQRSKMGALVFARWCMVMANFERELYRDPDQDLNRLWWQMVSRYQFLTAPEARNAPDWASKIHLVSSPVYYHNYLLGDLYASQLHSAIWKRFFPGQSRERVIYADTQEVGQFLTERVFRPGRMWRWDRFVQESTGEPLSARAFAEAFVSSAR